MYIEFFPIHVNNNAYLPVSTGCLTLQFFLFHQQRTDKSRRIIQKIQVEILVSNYIVQSIFIIFALSNK